LIAFPRLFSHPDNSEVSSDLSLPGRIIRNWSILTARKTKHNTSVKQPSDSADTLAVSRMLISKADSSVLAQSNSNPGA
jgi:hypothetical protein